jgi:regulator of replication initiation timing
MSESQFDKLLRTLGKTREEIERLREDNEVLRGESQRLRWESKRLRGLLRECQVYVEGMSSVDSELCDRVEKELSYE